MSVEILSTAVQLYKKITIERFKIGNVHDGDSWSMELPLFGKPYINSY